MTYTAHYLETKDKSYIYTSFRLTEIKYEQNPRGRRLIHLLNPEFKYVKTGRYESTEPEHIKGKVDGVIFYKAVEYEKTGNIQLNQLNPKLNGVLKHTDLDTSELDDSELVEFILTHHKNIYLSKSQYFTSDTELARELIRYEDIPLLLQFNEGSVQLRGTELQMETTDTSMNIKLTNEFRRCML